MIYTPAQVIDGVATPTEGDCDSQVNNVLDQVVLPTSIPAPKGYRKVVRLPITSREGDVRYFLAK